jgi:hypothetical protein
VGQKEAQHKCIILLYTILCTVVPPVSADSVYVVSVICGSPWRPRNWKIKEINISEVSKHPPSMNRL